MGFRTLLQKIQAIEPATEATRAQIATLRRLLGMPALMVSLRANYEALGVVRPLAKARVLEYAALVGARVLRTPETVDRPLAPLIRHLVRCFAQHVHHGNPEVRRYGQICTDLCEDEEALALLCCFADGAEDARLRDAVRAVLTWTMSECSRLGAPIMPFVEE